MEAETAVGARGSVEPAAEPERRVYEAGYHLIPAIAEEELAPAVAEVKSAIEERGGIVLAEAFPVHLTLAYPMEQRKQRGRERYASAYFGWIKFEADAAQAEALERALKDDERVLRFLLIQTVREHTRAPRRPQGGAAGERRSAAAAEGKHAEVSEEELDRAVDELTKE